MYVLWGVCMHFKALICCTKRNNMSVDNFIIAKT